MRIVPDGGVVLSHTPASVDHDGSGIAPMMDYEEGRDEGPHPVSRSEAAAQPEMTIRPVSSGDTASSIFREQQDGQQRKDVLVLDVPAEFATTRDALEWVKEIKALEREAYGKCVLGGVRGKPPSVAYDPGESLPCLVVLAPALEGIEDRCARRKEEERRIDLAEAGAIVFERVSPEAGGCLDLEDIREALRPVLQLEAEAHHGPGSAPADDPAEAFFRELSRVPSGDEAYGRFPSHVKPLTKRPLEKQVEKAFEEYEDHKKTPWWRLDY